ncbi:MAG: chemotaxis protein CheC [Clostridiales Family XIII bacterium]|nr:chemotaxis protein CheC [Clostridiales Family XIII bacterium]
MRIVQSMAMIDPDEFNDMIESALREIANIVSGSAASKIAEWDTPATSRRPSCIGANAPSSSAARP